jgi:hypothetical protein
MQVTISINGEQLTTLLDSGSTHNFIDMASTEQAELDFKDQVDLRVAVANEDRLNISGDCQDLQILIGGEAFVINCYGSSLGSYDMVLGVQWLESPGPILGDFDNRTMAFVRNGH